VTLFYTFAYFNGGIPAVISRVSDYLTISQYG